MREQTVAEKLAEFKTFGNKWGYENSIGFDEYVLNKAQQLSDNLLSSGCNATNVFPGSAGEILLVGYVSPFSFEININKDGTFECYAEIAKYDLHFEDEIPVTNLDNFMRYVRSMIRIINENNKND